jgi:16S rRNA (cytidine1402-2'-O)-methyltransferase
MIAGALYLVPTPIGNLEDITLRALNLLKSVNVILAEDTRQTAKLLQHYQIQTQVQSYHMHNEHKILSHLTERLKSGTSMALVSDAGTPGISDPGYLLVRACVKEQIPVFCLPGATAFVPALVKSGIPCNTFTFLGFLPDKKGRQTTLQYIANSIHTTVIYESPHRLLKTLEQLKQFCGADRTISVSREISKLFEETITNTAEAVLQHFLKHPVKGEFVIVINGKK